MLKVLWGIVFLLQLNVFSCKLLGQNSMTQDRFQEIVDRFNDVFLPLFYDKGADFFIDVRWESDELTAKSGGADDYFFVIVNGGLIRNTHLSEDGLMLILCHEMGHLLGGFPYTNGGGSAEGQADYFATQACIGRIWDVNQDFLPRERSIGFIERVCKTWEDSSSQFICRRVLAAIDNIGHYWQWKNKLSVRPQIGKPDKSLVDKTITEGYPPFQCRIDTMLAGALCQTKFKFSPVPSDYQAMVDSSCSTGTNYLEGNRPPCWFRSLDWNSSSL